MIDPAFVGVDVDYGVDYERSLEQLDIEAGRIFRRYREAKASPHATAATIEALRDEYHSAVSARRRRAPH